MSETVRIAMWSGPRNISTAMMRAFENRDDCIVSDEPFYAHYLNETGLDHPGREEVIASQPVDWKAVLAHITGPPPQPARFWYQKHMTQHMLPHIDLSWFGGMRHAFLIRDPLAVVGSYAKKRPNVTPEDIGLARQSELFDQVVEQIGAPPPVLDAEQVLQDPETALRLLCDALEVPFAQSMLSWPAGRRASDGIWAKYWYARVEGTTGFAPYQPIAVDLPAQLQAVADTCRPLYDRLYAYRLGA